MPSVVVAGRRPVRAASRLTTRLHHLSFDERVVRRREIEKKGEGVEVEGLSSEGERRS